MRAVNSDGPGVLELSARKFFGPVLHLVELGLEDIGVPFFVLQELGEQLHGKRRSPASAALCAAVLYMATAAILSFRSFSI